MKWRIIKTANYVCDENEAKRHSFLQYACKYYRVNLKRLHAAQEKKFLFFRLSPLLTLISTRSSIPNNVLISVLTVVSTPQMYKTLLCTGNFIKK